ncbi:pyrroloquinoline quinone precursor peptide PqqA [Streptomyces sp. AS02]|nr:pyrroloquinoline quinone precursor peptide PqqA [Streptomyces sp. AS02]MCL8014890.1 pyrroloquinoline quinone precursor peptide PqqA [Streptomyces sp. AS02]
MPSHDIPASTTSHHPTEAPAADTWATPDFEVIDTALEVTAYYTGSKR